MTTFHCFIVALFPHRDMHTTYNFPHTVYNMYSLPLALSPCNYIKIVFDVQLCIFIILQKVKQVSVWIKMSWLYIESWERVSTSVCTPKHSFLLIGIHWRICWEEILMCMVINWNKWKICLISRLNLLQQMLILKLWMSAN